MSLINIRLRNFRLLKYINVQILSLQSLKTFKVKDVKHVCFFQKTTILENTRSSVLNFTKSKLNKRPAEYLNQINQTCN